MNLINHETATHDLPEFEKDGYGESVSLNQLQKTFPEAFQREQHLAPLLAELEKLKIQTSHNAQIDELIKIKIEELLIDLEKKFKESEPVWELATTEIEEKDQGVTFIKKQVKAGDLRPTIYEHQATIDKISLFINTQQIVKQAKIRIKELETKITNAEQVVTKKEEELANLRIKPENNGKNYNADKLQEQIRHDQKRVSTWKDKRRKLKDKINEITLAITNGEEYEQIQDLYEKIIAMFDSEPDNFNVISDLLIATETAISEIGYYLVDYEAREKAIQQEEQERIKEQIKKDRKNMKGRILTALGLGIATPPLLLGTLLCAAEQESKKVDTATGLSQKTAMCVDSRGNIQLASPKYKNKTEAKAEARGFVKTMQDKGLIAKDADTTAIEASQNPMELEDAVFSTMDRAVIEYTEQDGYITIQPNNHFMEGMKAIHGSQIKMEFRTTILGPDDKELESNKRSPQTYKKEDFCRVLADNDHSFVMGIEHYPVNDRQLLPDIGVHKIPADHLCE